MSIFLDAHVHIYQDFPLEELLDAALLNFREAVGKTGDGEACDYALLLTENVGVNVYSDLRTIAESENGSCSSGVPARGGRWQYHITGESGCLVARNGKGESLFIFAGRQLISSEKLEVLSLLSPLECADYTFPVEELITRVWEAGGVAVLPWGVGKWMGKRGQILDKFIQDGHRYQIILGDNGNRPLFWSYPKQLTLAERNGWPVVSGSDPLPLPDHYLRVGSFGVWAADCRLDPASPIKDLQSILTDADKLNRFGRKTGAFRFFKDQVLVNMRKRLPKSI